MDSSPKMARSKPIRYSRLILLAGRRPSLEYDFQSAGLNLMCRSRLILLAGRHLSLVYDFQPAGVGLLNGHISFDEQYSREIDGFK